MNRKYIYLTLLTILTILGGVYSFRLVSKKTTNVDYSDTSKYILTSISNLKSIPLQSSIYYTEGYIVYRYECPPCPANDQCKPCMRNNIVISEKSTPLKSYDLSDTELLIFTDNPQQFELGKKYKFLIRLPETKSTSEPLNNFELVWFGQ
jgi:hypothetical protein